MKLHEYQSKTIFSKYGIPIPKGRVAATADEAKQIAEELGGRVVIKSQVLVGGRGKAGGVKVAKNSKEAAEFAGLQMRPQRPGSSAVLDIDDRVASQRIIVFAAVSPEVLERQTHFARGQKAPALLF
mgnify:CR=1 FL=1